MSTHLCITVRWIGDRFHGFIDGTETIEWPPSPFRLFEALVAGAHRYGLDETKRDALAWIERQRIAPDVLASSQPSTGTIFDHWVPDNDNLLNHRRGSIRKFCPVLLETGPLVHYVWQIDPSDQPPVGALDDLTCTLSSLGWAIDQAYAAVTLASVQRFDAAILEGDHLSRFQPVGKTASTNGSLRVPKPGSVCDLERVHAANCTASKNQAERRGKKWPKIFDRVLYVSSERPIGRPYRVFEPRPPAVFELPEGVAFRQEDACAVAATLRSLACDDKRYRNRQDFQTMFPRDDPEVYLAGHVSDAKQTPPRFSYLPLPSIGHEHADGMIRRLLIAEPFGGDGSHARWAQNRLRGLPLTDKDGNERGILLDLWRRTSANMVMRYIDDARTWSTVTPVILPGFDDGKQVKAEKLFLTAVQQAELPVDAIEELSLRKVPFWPGSQHLSQYHVPAYLKHFSRWHVCLVFREPIGGPLAIGAGRHCGLGLFAAVESS